MKPSERVMQIFDRIRQDSAALLSDDQMAYFETRHIFRAILEYLDEEAAKTAQPATEARELKFAVYAWLGIWRDRMPPEAVSDLQKTLGPLPEAKERSR